MAGTVWTKFYWSDWATDPAVCLCSMAAQGLWMRMLCIAAAHDPIGYVAVAGKGLDETSLARLTGCQESEVASLLAELDRNGVFSRDRHGRIYSRRMTRDARKSATARKNGKLGGNPTLSNNNEISASDNPEDNPGVNTQEPEAMSQKEKERPSGRSKKHPKGQDEMGFRAELATILDAGRVDGLVAVRVKKKGVLNAEVAKLLIGKIKACGLSPVAAADMMLLRNWISIDPDWDEVARARSKPAMNGANGHMTGDQWRERLVYARRERKWASERWGPPPGADGCLVPAEMLQPGDGQGWIEYEHGRAA